MNCCCYPDHTTTQNNIYVNNYQTIQVKQSSTHKPKFSFRNSMASSKIQSNPQEMSQVSLATHQYDQEIEQL